MSLLVSDNDTVELAERLSSLLFALDRSFLISLHDLIRCKSITEKIEISKFCFDLCQCVSKVNTALNHFCHYPNPEIKISKDFVDQVKVAFDSSDQSIRSSICVGLASRINSEVGFIDWPVQEALACVQGILSKYPTSNVPIDPFWNTQHTISRLPWKPGHLQDSLPSVPSSPARAPEMREGKTVFLTPQKGEQRPIEQSLHKQLFGIEILASELCAWAVLQFSISEIELRNDLMRQLWDEARHARILYEKFCEFNLPLHYFSINFDIWNYATSATSISEYLAIQNLVGEGFGLGNDLLLAERYARAGRSDLSRIHQSIHFDEILHTRIGLEWIQKISGSKSSEIIEDVEKRFPRPTISGEFFVEDLRRDVGFSEAQIERQRKRAKPKEI